MLNRNVKAAYFTVAGPIMSANGRLYRRFRAPKAGDLKVHLGPGQTNYLEGWINVDANIVTAKCDVWADLRNPLPFHDGTVAAMYSHHVVEHLPNIVTHFKDAFRCLKSGGVYRVGGPNGDSAIAKFHEKDLNWFGDFPYKRRSIGGRFENFLLCGREHLSILTASYLEELLTDAGFTDVKTCLPIKQTHHPELFQSCLEKEWESDFEAPHTLLVEAVKP
jgi:SAM-dependent methyltransferase